MTVAHHTISEFYSGSSAGAKKVIKKQFVYDDQTGESPQILQQFIQPYGTTQNTIFKVEWSPSFMRVKRYSNKAEMADPRYSVTARMITCEDEAAQGLFSKSDYIERETAVYRNLTQSMHEM